MNAIPFPNKHELQKVTQLRQVWDTMDASQQNGILPKSPLWKLFNSPIFRDWDLRLRPMLVLSYTVKMKIFSLKNKIDLDVEANYFKDY